VGVVLGGVLERDHRGLVSIRALKGGLPGGEEAYADSHATHLPGSVGVDTPTPGGGFAVHVFKQARRAGRDRSPKVVIGDPVRELMQVVHDDIGLLRVGACGVQVAVDTSAQKGGAHTGGAGRKDVVVGAVTDIEDLVGGDTGAGRLRQGQGLFEEGRIGFAHAPVVGDADAFHAQVHGLEGGTGPGGLVTGNDQGEPLGAHRRKSGSHVCVQVGLPEVFALAVGVLGTPPRTLGGQIEPGNERAYTVG